MEMLSRQLLLRPGFLPVDAEQLPGLLVQHPTRGYAHSANYSGSIRTGERELEIVTNSLGLRDAPIELGENIQILAVGNSFTVGYGVESAEAWPAQLESFVNSTQVLSHPIRVVNAGVSGYSLTQIRVLSEESLGLNPEMIVLGLYSSRYSRINNPYVYFQGRIVRSSKLQQIKVVDGGLLHTDFRNPWLKSIDFWFDDNFWLGAYTIKFFQRIANDVVRQLSSEDLAEKLNPLLIELKKIHRISVEHDIPLVVVLVNDQEADGRFTEREKKYNAIVKSFCKDSGILVFDPLPLLEEQVEGANFRLGSDNHWSEQAHTLVGEELANFLTEKNLLESLPEKRTQ